jgi:hypothetical protein
MILDGRIYARTKRTDIKLQRFPKIMLKFLKKIGFEWAQRMIAV